MKAITNENTLYELYLKLRIAICLLAYGSEQTHRFRIIFSNDSIWSRNEKPQQQ